MMDTSGMLPYDSRSMNSGPLQRPVMGSPQYVMSNAYSAAPITTMAAPAYEPQPSFGYAAYTPPSPAVAPSFKSQFSDRTTPRVMSVGPEADRGLAYPRDCPTQGQSRSPSLKSEPVTAAKSRNNSITASKTVKANASIKNPGESTFSTDIDILMKAIQAKKETEELIARNERIPSPQSDHDVPQQEMKPGHLKRYRCDFEDCGYSADQKTHLDIHWRTHTGEKPYICKYPGCNSKFTQHGNLKTHENRHTGHKPYPCPECGKKFAQRGNVRAHLHTHSQTKPFCCILDNCYKRFTQRGNLKQHQNKFHESTVKTLTAKFANMDPEKASKADQELWEYFATLYKNSNKGIKGRGKNRNVGPVARVSPVVSNSGISPQYPMQQPHHTHMPPPTHHHGLSHPAAYSMSRGGPGLNIIVGPDGLPAHRDSHTGYEMYDDSDSINGSGTASTMSGTMYDEDHGRTELGFSDRIY